MNKSILLLLLVLLLIMGCKDKITYIEASKIQADSIILKPIYAGSCINYLPRQEGLLISFISGKYDKLKLYNIDNHLIIDSLPFDKRSAEQQYYIDNHKNVYVFKTNQNILTVTDSLGNEANLYKKTEYLYTPGDTFTQTYSSMALPIQIIDSTFVMNRFWNCYVGNNDERNIYFSGPSLCCLKVGHDSISKKTDFAIFPEFYRKHFVDEYWPAATRAGNNIFYLFSNSNTIYKYNIETQKSNKYIVTNLGKNILPDFDLGKLQDFSYNSEYENNRSTYLILLHDDKNNEFAVFQMMQVNNTNDEPGTLHIFQDKPILVSLIDSHFSVYKKIYFEDNSKFNLRYNCFYDGKLYMTEHTTNDSQDSLKIYVYDIKKTE